MKSKFLNLLSAIVLCVSSAGVVNADVIFDFPNGLLFSQSNPSLQVGTFNLTSTIDANPLDSTTAIQAFQIPGTTNVAIQGSGSDFNSDPTISLTVNLTDPSFSIVSFNVASTETVNGAPPAVLGFNIGNAAPNGNNAADLGLSFNVPGTFTTGTTPGAAFVFDAVNSDIQADGPLAAGQIAAADTLTSGNHADDTFLFVASTPIGNGGTFDTTITSFNNNSISGEAFRFDINIVETVPEPTSFALLCLSGLALTLRRKRC